MIEIWLGKSVVDRSSVVLVISLRRVIDYHATLNCEGLLLSELACREELVRKDNRWLLVGRVSYTGGAPSTCLQARLSNRRPLPCRQWG